MRKLNSFLSLALALVLGFSFSQGALAVSETSTLGASTLSGELFVNEVRLNWTRNTDDDFKFYKIVKSTLNNLPAYPDQDAIFSTDDVDELSFKETIDLQSNHYYRLCTVNTKNDISCGNILQFSVNRLVSSHNYYMDVDSEAWYAEYVENLYKKEIISADSDVSFSPATLVNRAELAEMMVKAAVSDESTLSSEQYFCDVSASHPQAKYINHLKTSGVVEGYAGGTCSSGKLFKPNQSVNRAEALKMILLGFGVDPTSAAVEEDVRYQDTDIYLDVHPSDWFAEYVLRAKNDGIVSGYPDDTFKPADTINRAEMSKIVFNSLKKYQQ